MAFKYNPPTRTHCPICEKIEILEPIMDSHNGKASSADNFAFHNWYNFVLGYSPEFPKYILKREKIASNSLVVDPFLGSGTTCLCAKEMGIESVGIEANDFFEFAASVKLNWDIDINLAEEKANEFFKNLDDRMRKYEWELLDGKKNRLLSPIEIAKRNRPKMLTERYISDMPFSKLLIIKELIDETKWGSEAIENMFKMAYSWAILPASNVRYGPGFGVAKPRIDYPVFEKFQEKVKRMLEDLKSVADKKHPVSKIILGDSRIMSEYLSPNSVDIMVTSPPYPGDHEYTKHSRLELIFNEFAQDLDEFRVIKKRMLRGSTTNIYKEDNEGDLIRDINEIKEIVEEIDKRLIADNATSGFEKLYTKLIWEYFGGMFNVFREAKKVLKPGGKFVLLVSDSHAFKMVHIKTADLLKVVAEKAGLVNGHIELWQYKNSTSHKYKLLENILTIEKAKY